jgi:hypothetical protein
MYVLLILDYFMVKSDSHRRTLSEGDVRTLHVPPPGPAVVRRDPIGSFHFRKADAPAVALFAECGVRITRPAESGCAPGPII